MKQKNGISLFFCLLLLSTAFSGCSQKEPDKIPQPSQPESSLQETSAEESEVESIELSESTVSDAEDTAPSSRMQTEKSSHTEGTKTANSNKPFSSSSSSSLPSAAQDSPPKTPSPPSSSSHDSQPESQPEESVPIKPDNETETASSEPEKPPFRIEDWIQFAQNYATNTLHLTLNEEAIYCSDNLIAANEKSLFLERDIKSRLNLYKRQGITDIWVWAEEISPGAYNLYIGYA